MHGPWLLVIVTIQAKGDYKTMYARGQNTSIDKKIHIQVEWDSQISHFHIINVKAYINSNE
ncbi:hypothetical protein SRABI96_01805 [Peribacillus sp. Bi96]|nr:hypothetical protein SRABI96_01805 [Peribacillus sp. Bi96]